MVIVQGCYVSSFFLNRATADEPKLPDGYTRQGLPSADPNVRRNYVPLEQDDFRVRTKLPDGEASAKLLTISKELYPGKPCEGCVAVKILVRNNTDAPLIMDGDNIKAIFSGSTLGAISEFDLLKISGGQFTKKQKRQLAAIAIASIGYAEPIAQDMMTTSKKDWTKSYGTDEIRRKLESARFGKRILLPEEQFEASTYFQPGEKTFEKLSIPLLSYPEEKVTGSLTVQSSPPALQQQTSN